LQRRKFQKSKGGKKMKKSFQLIMGIGVLLLFTVSVSFSQAYFVSLSGTGFLGQTEIEDWSHVEGYVYKPTSTGWVDAQIVFPDDLRYIERMSITYYDFMTTGEIKVELVKKNRWDGTTTVIATKSTGQLAAANVVQTTSVILGTGRGINNANFIYYIRVYFNNFGANLRFHSVSFKCQY
jgi:hypothetical protein